MQYKDRLIIEFYEHGIGVRGAFPIDVAQGLVAMGRARGYDLLDAGVASALGLSLFVTNAAGGAAARAAIDAGNVGKNPIDAWLAGPDTGISSRTIVEALTGRPVLNGWRPSTPHDPSDFGRCHRLLEAVPGLRSRLGEVAERHPSWVGLVDAWDELTALWLEESPTGRCPKLYARMKEIGC